MESLGPLFESDVLVFMIPIVAIIAYMVNKIAKAYFTHAERMEMIRNGMDPDATADASKD